MPSTVIEQFRYDPQQRKLYVKFRPSGRQYVYMDVPPDIYSGLLEASSRGAFFNARIRDDFSFLRLDDSLKMTTKTGAKR